MNDPQTELDQWLAYRREQTDGLDIRQAVQRELAGSTLPASPPTSDSHTLRFPLLRITTSALFRFAAVVGWFFASA